MISFGFSRGPQYPADFFPDTTVLPPLKQGNAHPSFAVSGTRLVGIHTPLCCPAKLDEKVEMFFPWGMESVSEMQPS